MKRIAFCTLCALAAMTFSSCVKDEAYKSFVGAWGVERIEYYSLDYAGQPIEASMESYDLIPGDPDNGIELIFRDDKSGEMRDSSQDTLWLDWNESTQTFETIIVCPDTTLVESFAYSFDEPSSVLIMSMKGSKIFKMEISDLTENSFVYVNEYEEDNIEKAYLKRLRGTTSGKTAGLRQKRPYKLGSFLSGR